MPISWLARWITLSWSEGLGLRGAGGVDVTQRQKVQYEIGISKSCLRSCYNEIGGRYWALEGALPYRRFRDMVKSIVETILTVYITVSIINILF